MRQQGQPLSDRPDGVLGERQRADNHFGGPGVKDCHTRVHETGQRSPELVDVAERAPVEAEIAAGLVDHRGKFGIRQGTCGVIVQLL